jgi:hypothetical protein
MCARIRHADMLDETKSRDDDPLKLKASRTRAADTCDDAAGGIRLVARRQIRPSGRLRRALVNSQHRPFSSSTLARPPFPRPSPATHRKARAACVRMPNSATRSTAIWHCLPAGRPPA